MASLTPIPSPEGEGGLRRSVTDGEHFGAPVASIAFGSEHRLRRRADFVRVQHSSVRVTSKNFVFLIAPGLAASWRVGITVTRKVGCAVVRNRARRLIREAIRHLPGFVPMGIDVVVIVRRALENMKLHDVVTEWQSVRHFVSKRSRAALAGGG